MTSVPYSVLTQEQLKQSAYLFADELFGTDASVYLYELDKSGGITGRRLVNETSSTFTRKVTRTNINSQPHADAAQVEAAKMHMDALSASIAEVIYQQQLEEVTP